MNKTELLLTENENVIDFEETTFKSDKLKGLCVGNTVLYDKRLTQAEKACILAEEVGHYYTTVGNILDTSTVNSAKQERIARAWASNKLISFDDIIKASKQGIANRFELAEYLEVTEEFLQETINLWKERYGLFIEHKNYIITLEPLGVLERM